MRTPAPRTLSRLAAALLAAVATNLSAATEYAYLDGIAGGWANWSWSTGVTNDTVVKKSGTASARVAITGAWGAFSLNRDAGAVGLGLLAAITFDVNPSIPTRPTRPRPSPNRPKPST